MFKQELEFGTSWMVGRDVSDRLTFLGKTNLKEWESRADEQQTERPAVNREMWGLEIISCIMSPPTTFGTAKLLSGNKTSPQVRLLAEQLQCYAITFKAYRSRDASTV